MPVILLPCSLIPQQGFGGKILCPPLRAAARVRFAGCSASLRNRPCTRAHCGRRIFLPPPLPPGGAALGLPAVPAGRSRRPFRRSCGGGRRLRVCSLRSVLGVHHGWFCFCLGFLSRRGRGRPAFGMRLGVGSPGLAWRRRLVARSGLPVRAVRFFCSGRRVRARRFSAGLAGVAAVRRFRFFGLVRLRLAGPGLRRQSGASVRAFLSCRLRGIAAGAGAVFAWGARCLVRLAWSPWPARGRCPRPVPPWWSGWRRISPPPALRSRSAAAPAPMRRCCRPCPDPCRRPWCAVSPRSAPVVKAPGRSRQSRPCRPSRPRAAWCPGGQAARLRSRCAPGWPAAPAW
jgi:hypothetical protein